MQNELDEMIQQGIAQLTRLLINSETVVSSGTVDVDDEDQDLPLSRKKASQYYRMYYISNLKYQITYFNNYLIFDLQIANRKDECRR